MKFKDWYNEEARKLWETQDHQSLYLPAQLGNYKENTEVLIVGMNPSFDTKRINKDFDSNPKLKGKESEKIFLWNDKKNIDSNYIDIREHESFCWGSDRNKNEHSYKTYFGKFSSFIKKCGYPEDSWAHIDLFLMRGTNQGEERRLIYEKKPKLNNFGEAQVDLFLEAVQKTKHKIIIVFNSEAAQILYRRIKNINPLNDLASLESKEDLETYLDFQNKRYFFTSMLTNGKLDIFSRQRLINEIRFFSKK